MSAEQKIMEYLKKLALEDNAIKEALDKKDKTPKKMMSYICGEAKKACEKGENQTCIDSDTVFQWARHYWLEVIDTDKEQDDEVDEENCKIATGNDLPKCQKKSQSKKQSNSEQLSLFEFGDEE